jgi:hypothetical protein
MGAAGSLRFSNRGDAGVDRIRIDSCGPGRQFGGVLGEGRGADDFDQCAGGFCLLAREQERKRFFLKKEAKTFATE